MVDKGGGDRREQGFLSRKGLIKDNRNIASLTPEMLLVSCGTSYASTVYGGLCKDRYRPVTAGSRRLDESQEGLKRKEIEDQISSIEVNLSNVMD